MPIQASERLTENAPGSERRVETRQPAQGEVILALSGPIPRMVSGQLLDTSRSGFRASHSSPLLETGSRVQFRFESVAGVARVCWNRSSGGRWETGFLILPK
jgi:hypothetical protein